LGDEQLEKVISAKTQPTLHIFNVLELKICTSNRAIDFSVPAVVVGVELYAVEFPM
jgi:hypothetical protein